MIQNLSQIALETLASLLATLIGVFIGFRLNNWRERKYSRESAIESLKAIKNELVVNQKIIDQNDKVIEKLDKEGAEPKKYDKVSFKHYTLDLYSSDSWESALNRDIIEFIGVDLFQGLTKVYSDIKDLNKLIRRTQIEWIHPDTNKENWSVGLTHYDDKYEDVEFTSLGPLITERSNSMDSDIEKLSKEIENKIKELEQQNQSLLPSII